MFSVPTLDNDTLFAEKTITVGGTSEYDRGRPITCGIHFGFTVPECARHYTDKPNADWGEVPQSVEHLTGCFPHPQPPWRYFSSIPANIPLT